MMKTQILVRGAPGTHATFAARVRSELVPYFSEQRPRALKLSITEAPPPRLAVVPLSRTPLALVSIWADDARIPESLPGASLAAYRVEESIPRAYDRTWPDGERTPGVGLLTLFRKKRGLSEAVFIDRWQRGHSRLALEVHPMWSYVRNEVREVRGARPLDGIVEEHFRAPEDLLLPWRFFGGALGMLPNMLRVGADIAGFIDLGSLECFLVAEHHLRS